MQTRAGSSGSDALSHAYIQSPPIRCNIPETRGLLYDDGNKLFLSPTADQVSPSFLTALIQISGFMSTVHQLMNMAFFINWDKAKLVRKKERHILTKPKLKSEKVYKKRNIRIFCKVLNSIYRVIAESLKKTLLCSYS